MSASIDNLINVNFTKGRNDLLNFGLKLGGRGDHNPYISPLNRLIILLFSNNEQGAFYIPRPVVNGVQSLFQDAAGTTPVTADGDPVGLMIDQSPNSNNAPQSVSAAKSTYRASPDRLSLDKVDDALIITVPTGGWNGTMVLATDEGTVSYGVDIPAGEYEIGGVYFPGNAINGVVFLNSAMTNIEKSNTEEYFIENGAGVDYSEVTSFSDYWRDRSEITEFPLIDTSSGTSFDRAWYNCYSLTSFPLIDTSSGTSLNRTWRGCTSLTNLPLIDVSNVTSFAQSWLYCSSLTIFPLIDTSKGENFERAWGACSSLLSFPALNLSKGTRFFNTWSSCTSLASFPPNMFDEVITSDFTSAFNQTSLNQESIDGILVSIVTSGIATGTRLFGQSGGSAPSVGTGQPAIDTLRSRGWTVSVTGGY